MKATQIFPVDAEQFPTISGPKPRPYLLPRDDHKSVLVSKFTKVALHSFSYEEPPIRVSSLEMESRLSTLYERLGVPSGMIEQTTGIQERKLYERGVESEDVAARCVEKLLHQANIESDDVGFLANASLDIRHFEPSGAAFIASKIGGCPSARLVDVRSACMSFVDAMSLGAQSIELGQCDVAVIVAAEAAGMRRAIDHSLERLQRPDCSEEEIRSQMVSLTMGCGAVAALLVNHEKFPQAHALHFNAHRNSPAGIDLCVGTLHDDGRLTLDSNGMGLMRHGAKLLGEIHRHVSQTDPKFARPDEIFAHQVTRPHTHAVQNALRLQNVSQHHIYPTWGNTGPVGMFLALALASEKNILRRGQRIALLGAGSGLAASITGVTW